MTKPKEKVFVSPDGTRNSRQEDVNEPPKKNAAGNTIVEPSSSGESERTSGGISGMDLTLEEVRTAGQDFNDDLKKAKTKLVNEVKDALRGKSYVNEEFAKQVCEDILPMFQRLIRRLYIASTISMSCQPKDQPKNKSKKIVSRERQKVSPYENWHKFMPNVPLLIQLIVGYSEDDHDFFPFIPDDKHASYLQAIGLAEEWEHYYKVLEEKIYKVLPKRSTSDGKKRKERQNGIIDYDTLKKYIKMYRHYVMWYAKTVELPPGREKPDGFIISSAASDSPSRIDVKNYLSKMQAFFIQMFEKSSLKNLLANGYYDHQAADFMNKVRASILASPSSEQLELDDSRPLPAANGNGLEESDFDDLLRHLWSHLHSTSIGPKAYSSLSLLHYGEAECAQSRLYKYFLPQLRRASFVVSSSDQEKLGTIHLPLMKPSILQVARNQEPYLNRNFNTELSFKGDSMNQGVITLRLLKKEEMLGNFTIKIDTPGNETIIDLVRTQLSIIWMQSLGIIKEADRYRSLVKKIEKVVPIDVFQSQVLEIEGQQMSDRWKASDLLRKFQDVMKIKRKKRKKINLLAFCLCTPQNELTKEIRSLVVHYKSGTASIESSIMVHYVEKRFAELFIVGKTKKQVDDVVKGGFFDESLPCLIRNEFFTDTARVLIPATEDIIKLLCQRITQFRLQKLCVQICQFDDKLQKEFPEYFKEFYNDAGNVITSQDIWEILETCVVSDTALELDSERDYYLISIKRLGNEDSTNDIQEKPGWEKPGLYAPSKEPIVDNKKLSEFYHNHQVQAEFAKIVPGPGDSIVTLGHFKHIGRKFDQLTCRVENDEQVFIVENNPTVLFPLYEAGTLIRNIETEEIGKVLCHQYLDFIDTDQDKQEVQCVEGGYQVEIKEGKLIVQKEQREKWWHYQNVEPYDSNTNQRGKKGKKQAKKLSKVWKELQGVEREPNKPPKKRRRKQGINKKKN